MPALFTSAVAVSVALGVPERSAPAGQPVRLAVVTGDGNVLVSRDDSASSIVAARCPAPPMPAEQDAASSGRGPDASGDEPDASEEPLPGLTSLTSPAAPENATGMALDTGEPSDAQDRASPARSACGSPTPPAQIAWRGDALYVACAAGPVYRWREDAGAWPVLLASRDDPDAGLPGAPAAPDRIVAMLGGADLWLADASQQLWLLADKDPEDGQDGQDDAAALRHIGAAPEPVAALAHWRGALVAAGATSVWRRSGADASWEPLVPIGACALSADRDSLWLAGPAGLIELTGGRVHVHALASVAGIAVRDGDVWLASGRGPVVRAPVATAASVLLAGTSRLAPGASTGSTDGVIHDERLRAIRARARRAHWLPEVVAQARWSRSHGSPGSTAVVPWPEQGPGSHAGELVLLLWLTWKLDAGDSVDAAAARSVP